MNNKELNKLDDLTLMLNFDLSILNSAIRGNENLEICCLESFVERLYQTSEEVRNIFNAEL